MLIATGALCTAALSGSSTSPGVRPTPYAKVSATFGKEQYNVHVQAAGDESPLPPLLLIPPVGVGIDKSFYNRLQSEWQLLGAPAAMHSPDLLGTGSATPKPRRFYSPEVQQRDPRPVACIRFRAFAQHLTQSRPRRCGQRRSMRTSRTN